MKNNSREKRTIVVRATPEMANWMHPQTEERKRLIQQKVEAAKARFLESRKNEEQSDSLLKENMSVPYKYLK